MLNEKLRRSLLILTFVLLILALAFDITGFVFTAMTLVTLIIINDILSEDKEEVEELTS